MKQFVAANDNESADRKQENKPWILTADECDSSHGKVKSGADAANYDTGNNRENNPFQRSFDTV
jgi:hypothetical protein